MPKVWNIKKDKNIPKGAVFVDRRTKWGNPFVLKSEADRDFVCDEYEKWLLANDDLMDVLVSELRGLDLICNCAPKRCHADLLLKLANNVRYCELCWIDYDLDEYPHGCPWH